MGSLKRAGVILKPQRLMFELELEAWYTDESMWPEITWENFVAWFEWELVQPVVW